VTKAVPFTQAAIQRAIRAAHIEGAAMVEVRPDGTIRVLLRKDYELAHGEQPEQTDGDDPWGNASA
jgi:hypothetical protein